jgi:hypothetical protein
MIQLERVQEWDAENYVLAADDGLQEFYSSPNNIIRVIKSSRIGKAWETYEENRNVCRISVGKIERSRRRLKIILKLVLKK